MDRVDRLIEQLNADRKTLLSSYEDAQDQAAINEYYDIAVSRLRATQRHQPSTTGNKS